MRLVFKPYKDALPEHIADRLTQVRDNYANMTEESVNSRKLNIFNRFDADITDLLRVDPENDLGRKYWNEMNPEQPAPPFTLPTAPAGVPEWAFLQVKDLGMLKRPDQLVDRQPADLRRRVWRRALGRQRLSELVAGPGVHGRGSRQAEDSL